MSAEHAEDIEGKVRVYTAVFGAVVILTLMNVMATHRAAGVALTITTVLMITVVHAASVTCSFQHLTTPSREIARRHGTSVTHHHA
ncbi:MAG TPA: hypothetical protein VGB12_09635 [bacterium]